MENVWEQEEEKRISRGNELEKEMQTNKQKEMVEEACITK